MKKEFVYKILGIPLMGIWITGYIYIIQEIYTWYAWIFIIPSFLMSAIGLIYLAKIIVDRWG